jgi:hypothetical protein
LAHLSDAERLTGIQRQVRPFFEHDYILAIRREDVGCHGTAWAGTND